MKETVTTPFNHKGRSCFLPEEILYCTASWVSLNSQTHLFWEKAESQEDLCTHQVFPVKGNRLFTREMQSLKISDWDSFYSAVWLGFNKVSNEKHLYIYTIFAKIYSWSWTVKWMHHFYHTTWRMKILCRKDSRYYLQRKSQPTKDSALREWRTWKIVMVLKYHGYCNLFTISDVNRKRRD